jgi:hypothetical protein
LKIKRGPARENYLIESGFSVFGSQLYQSTGTGK